MEEKTSAIKFIKELKSNKSTFRGWFVLYYNFNVLVNYSIKISKILMAASLILVPGPNTATAPASNKYW